MNYNKGKVFVKNGILIAGMLTKDHIGPSGGSIIHYILREYGTEAARQFITNATFVCDNFLLMNGLTFGLKDCFIDQETIGKILSEVKEKKAEIEYLEEKRKKARNKQAIEASEADISKRLEDLTKSSIILVDSAMSKDSGMRIIIDAKTGRLSIAVLSQISSPIGVQLIQNSRPKPVLYGNRTLVWFPYNDNSIESRGFVNSSFLEGMNPTELFFHHMAGRTSLLDMALRTADTGYAQRKINKFLADLTTRFDMSVRDGINVIVQFLYGDDSFDPEKSISVSIGKREIKSPFDIKKMFDNLNVELLK